ncbi:hypothetical protein D6D22_05652 [Aureobasidium pullulans]|uniref:Uncharacterized protein n=1 Tax=Aureobasidium pullulans TaxID=5580 RepID=A0A4S8XQV5_AURPU|nr:hypothetical protein D6D22_05652 [Aureobasidium pullulans]
MPCSGDTRIDLETGKESISVDSLSRRHNRAATCTTSIRDKTGVFHPCAQSRIQNIPPLAIGFLDLANSGDFAANVFNQVPVPAYAVALMAIGATVALVMSFVAFWDAKRSCSNIRLLRKERKTLEESSGDHRVELDINHRDLGTEIFDRAGVEIAMGVGAFLISIGTYMAIGGANRAVWFGSNLLSGYIGNALPALYGVLNAGWSVYVWVRAQIQAEAAQSHLDDAVVCLVSGALSMVTPTQCWPYPVLLVFGLAFIYGTWVYKTQIGYERPLFTESYLLDKEYLVPQICTLQTVKTAMLVKTDAWNHLNLGNLSMSDLIRFMTNCDLFGQFCLHLLNESCLGPRLIVGAASSVTLDESSFSVFEQEDRMTEIHRVARCCIERYGMRQVRLRERYLLEALGCHLTNQRMNEKHG